MGFNKLKYSFAKLKNLSPYLNSINDNFLDKILGHHKIIGWWRGHPVNSSFLVPGLSKPLGNLIAMNLIKNMSGKPVPGIVNIGITDKQAIIFSSKCANDGVVDVVLAIS